MFLHGAVRLDPHSASAQHALGWCLNAMGRFDEALQAGRRAVDLDGGTDPAYQYFLGCVLAKMSRFTEALPYAERAVQAAPDDFDYRSSLGHIQFKLDRYDDLAANGRQLIRLQPRSEAGYDCLGWAQMGKWRFGAAQESFRSACKLSPNDWESQVGFQEARRKLWALRAGIAIVITLVVLRFRRYWHRRTTKPSVEETPIGPASP